MTVKTHTRQKPSRASRFKSLVAKSTLMLVNDCPSSTFGVHVPDVFTLEGDLNHTISKYGSVRFSISCSCCRKQGVGVIPLADIHWDD
jgi:hypothetical protein